MESTYRIALVARLGTFLELLRSRSVSLGLDHVVAADLSESELLPTVISTLKHADQDPLIWTFLVFVYGKYPTTAEFLRFSRFLRNQPVDRVAVAVLSGIVPWPANWAQRKVRIVCDQVLLVVDPAPTRANLEYEGMLNYLVPRWLEHGNVIPVGWFSEDSALGRFRKKHSNVGVKYTLNDDAVIVPVGGTLVFLTPTVGEYLVADRIACAARFSGLPVNFVGYGLSGITKASSHTEDEVNHTSAYVSALKYGHQIACLSADAQAEFAGLGIALPTQGLLGPAPSLIPYPTINSSAAWDEFATAAWEFLAESHAPSEVGL